MFYFNISNEEVMEEAKEFYNNLINAGETEEIARMLLESFLLCN